MTGILTVAIISILISLVIIKKINKEFSLKKSLVMSFLFNIVLTYLVVRIYPSYFNKYTVIISYIVSSIIDTLLLSGNIRIKSIPKFIITMVLFFMISIVEIIPATIFKMDINNLTSSQSVMLNLFSTIVLFITFILLYRKELVKEFNEFKKNFNAYFDIAFKWWFVGFILMIIFNLIIATFIKGASANNENAVQSMINISPFIMVLSAGVIGPFTEEITFRKSFKNLINNKYVYIITSGLIFGLMHVVFSYTSLLDFFYVIPYGILGGCFAITCYETDNIFPSTMMHMIHNTMIIMISIIGNLTLFII